METVTKEQELDTALLGATGDVANALENEAIYIIREVAAQFERPVLLFSGGKDSITLVRLAQKAFWPAKIPFPLMHIDTGHNFPETIEFRDRLVEELGLELIVRNVQDSIDQGKVKEETGKYASRNMLQTTTLLDAIEEFKFDACIGGAEETRRKLAPRKEFFQYVMILVSGTRKTNVRSCSIC